MANIQSALCIFSRLVRSNPRTLFVSELQTWVGHRHVGSCKSSESSPVSSAEFMFASNDLSRLENGCVDVVDDDDDVVVFIVVAVVDT